MKLENTGSKTLFNIKIKTESGRYQHTAAFGDIKGRGIDNKGKPLYFGPTYDGPSPRPASAVYTFTWKLANYYGEIYSKTIDLSKEFPYGLTGDLIFSINSDTGEVTWRTEKGYYGSEEFRQRRFAP